jgi:nucleoside-diphosphate-sugar epimerase
MTGEPAIGLLGATGFIGSHVRAYGEATGTGIAAVAMPRVQEVPDQIDATAEDGRAVDAIAAAARRWRRANEAAFDNLCRELAPFEVVINAVGDSRAGATTPNLLAANAVLPAVVALAAQRAGLRRLLHISTAAVQGRLDPLDETALHWPLSPYAQSKAYGERVLFDADPAGGQICPELVVYRPTSVQAVGHHATATFARVVAKLPVVPVAGPGDRPVPVVQLDNVAAGILFAATMAEPAPIVLQVDELMTVRRLVELFGARRTVTVPAAASGVFLDQVAKVTRRSASLTSRLRWFELLLRGQATHAKVLASAGFSVPAGDDGWVALAAAQRASDDGRRGIRVGARSGAGDRGGVLPAD